MIYIYIIFIYLYLYILMQYIFNRVVYVYRSINYYKLYLYMCVSSSLFPFLPCVYMFFKATAIYYTARAHTRAHTRKIVFTIYVQPTRT